MYMPKMRIQSEESTEATVYMKPGPMLQRGSMSRRNMWLMNWSLQTLATAPMLHRHSAAEKITWKTLKLARKYAVENVELSVGGSRMRTMIDMKRADSIPREKNSFRTCRCGPSSPAAGAPARRKWPRPIMRATSGEAETPEQSGLRRNASLMSLSRCSKRSMSLRLVIVRMLWYCTPNPLLTPKTLSCFFKILNSAAWLISAKLRSRVVSSPTLLIASSPHLCSVVSITWSPSVLRRRRCECSCARALSMSRSMRTISLSRICPHRLAASSGASAVAGLAAPMPPGVREGVGLLGGLSCEMARLPQGVPG
mmetsp:Transcript_21180/g.59577  ORF Transcript_21180/g.59577 Transcript_21180/m.59577 type:complete len:311 (+) Transcript_21180:1140-2072(+)